MNSIFTVVVLVRLAVPGVSAGQFNPDFTGDGRTGNVEFSEAMSAFSIPLPQVPAIEDNAGASSLGTEGYNPGLVFSPDPADTPEPSSKNVFIGNKRRKVTKTSWPWIAVGRLDLPGGGHCTAALVGADIILTNAHCVMDQTKGELIKGDYVFRPGFKDGRSEYSSTINHAWWGNAWPSSHRGEDWALMRLDQPLGKTLGWFGTRIRADLPQTKFTMSGYSGDFEDGRSASWEKGCSFTSGITGIGVILHNCSSSRGSSGSPMFFFDEENRAYVIALNAAEFRDGEYSHIDIPYSDARANIALPSAPFIPTLREVLGLGSNGTPPAKLR